MWQNLMYLILYFELKKKKEQREFTKRQENDEKKEKSPWHSTHMRTHTHTEKYQPHANNQCIN